MKHHFPLLLILVSLLSLVGCESSEEKAERQRLERLYSLDNKMVAQNFLAGITKGASYQVEYNELKRECAKESLLQKGKWCAKFEDVNKIYRQLHSDATQRMFERR